jgi:hypothetical protein
MELFVTAERIGANRAELGLVDADADDAVRRSFADD